MSDDPDYAALVRRDVRAFAVSGALVIAALAVMVLWGLDVLGNDGRVAMLGLGLAAFVVSFVAWATGDRYLRERLFVLGPGIASALPIGLGLGGQLGLATSFALALLATWAFVLSRATRG